MRSLVLAAALCAALLFADPATAQLAADVPAGPAPVEVVSPQHAPTLSLEGLFNARTLKLSHGYQYGYQTGPGGDLGMGVYTTSLRWQPGARLAGRVDVGFAHGAVGSLADAAGFSPDRPVRPFLQNAELGWRPTETSLVQLRVSQSPYGAACSSGYGVGLGSSCGDAYSRATMGHGSGVSGDLFWRADLGEN